MGQDRIKEWKNQTWNDFRDNMPNLMGGETRQEKELTIFGKRYIFNPNSTTKDDFFRDVLDPYLTNETDGRRILKSLNEMRIQEPGSLMRMITVTIHGITSTLSKTLHHQLKKKILMLTYTQVVIGMNLTLTHGSWNTKTLRSLVGSMT